MALAEPSSCQRDQVSTNCFETGCLWKHLFRTRDRNDACSITNTELPVDININPKFDVENKTDITESTMKINFIFVNDCVLVDTFVTNIR